MFAAPFRAWVQVSGEDRTRFLQGMLTNDVQALAPGEGVYAAVITQQAKMVSDVRAYCMPDCFVLDFPARAAPQARSWLERFVVADDVEFAPVEASLVAAEGPDAEAVLRRAGVLPPPGQFGARCVEWEGVSVRVAGASHTGEKGWVVGGARGAVEALRERLVRAGAVPVGAEALEVLRIEAGIPSIGIDMDGSTLILEADLQGAVSFRKGCYLGQEVVERVAARGQVKRLRRGFVLEEGRVAPGSRLFAGAREVGWITSAGWSPHLRKFVAMGYVRREWAEPGTELAVQGEGGAEGVTRVAGMPFYPQAGRCA